MENQSEKIQDYIEGQLQGDDLLEFEAQLAIDEELRELLSLHQEVSEILSQRIVSKEVELRETLVMAATSYRDQKASKPVFRVKRTLPYLVAAILLCVGAVFFFNRANSLYDLPILSSEIVRGQEENVTFEDAVRTFNKQHFVESGALFSQLQAGSPSQIQYAYYIGLSYVGEEKWDRAVEVLLPVATGESVFADEAKYYLAISYEKTGRRNEAVEMLKQINGNHSQVGKNALLLLKQLN